MLFIPFIIDLRKHFGIGFLLLCTPTIPNYLVAFHLLTTEKNFSKLFSSRLTGAMKTLVTFNYHLRSLLLLHETEEKDLGIIVNNNISWDSYIYFIAEQTRCFGSVKEQEIEELGCLNGKMWVTDTIVTLTVI